MSDHYDAHLTWWKAKLARMGDRTFLVPKYGPQIIDVLIASKEGRIDAENLKELGMQLGVSLKYVPRAVASVTRLGIVSAHLQPPKMFVTIHPDRLARRKNGLSQLRRPISRAEREALKLESEYRCACCGDRFSPRDLVIDHVIPLGLLGADAPGNWVVMSRAHNGKKWDRFVRGEVKLYRTEKVLKPFGVRFIGGAFWPVINGKVRY